jgi:Txe/YoeB family toxin of Txe-Axe toxin-antitoxin module
MNNEVFSIKVSVNRKYQKIIDFYTKDNSLSKLINVLLDECEKDKPFKFKILKKLEKLEK